MGKYEEMFGLEACLESIRFDVEKLGRDPKEMLGEYIIRAEQDVFFNKKMIDAMKLYIRENGIRWNDISRSDFARMAWKMSYEEYLACDCTRCREKECVHRGCFRRLPKIDGGLGLCPNLAKFK